MGNPRGTRPRHPNKNKHQKKYDRKMKNQKKKKNAQKVAANQDSPGHDPKDAFNENFTIHPILSNIDEDSLSSGSPELLDSPFDDSPALEINSSSAHSEVFFYPYSPTSVAIYVTTSSQIQEGDDDYEDDDDGDGDIETGFGNDHYYGEELHGYSIDMYFLGTDISTWPHTTPDVPQYLQDDYGMRRVKYQDVILLEPICLLAHDPALAGKKGGKSHGFRPFLPFRKFPIERKGHRRVVIQAMQLSSTKPWAIEKQLLHLPLTTNADDEDAILVDGTFKLGTYMVPFLIRTFVFDYAPGNDAVHDTIWASQSGEAAFTMPPASWRKVQEACHAAFQNHPGLVEARLSNLLRNKERCYELKDCRQCIACSRARSCKIFTNNRNQFFYKLSARDGEQSPPPIVYRSTLTQRYLYPVWEPDDGEGVEWVVSEAIRN